MSLLSKKYLIGDAELMIPYASHPKKLYLLHKAKFRKQVRIMSGLIYDVNYIKSLANKCIAAQKTFFHRVFSSSSAAYTGASVTLGA